MRRGARSNHRVGDVAMSRFSDFNPTVLTTRLKLYPCVSLCTLTALWELDI